MDWLTAILIVLLVFVLTQIFKGRRTPAEVVDKFNVGDITLEALQFYCGYDYTKPLLLAVKGTVYDVSKASDVYGPGKELHVYAGKEVSRALALDSRKEEDCTSVLHDLDEDQIDRLKGRIQELAVKYDVVGQVVPMKELTLEQLGEYDGKDPAKPLYLAIKGTVYDITKGKHFYGPDGVYPFAGKEVARAFALLSTEVADCNDNMEGLSYTELDNLREWTAKFNSKYPIVGKLLKP